jgi:hypothetical protein
VGQASLPDIEIDGGGVLAHLHERDSNVHGNGGFA